jgi:3-(3-hydroxy-phenyl)propionate hydroxylase
MTNQEATLSEEASNEIYDVIIVGLGPTGLTLAHLLGRRGLRVLALEREPAFYGKARAVYTDDECMRVFQAARVADDVEPDMLVDTPAQWVFGDGSVLAQFVRTDRLYGWAVSNFFYQPNLETKLESLLARYPNVTAWRGRELTRFAQKGDRVIVTHAASVGSQYESSRTTASDAIDVRTITARWLVACDGGRSGVRSALGVKMIGKSFPNPWLVVDIKAKRGNDGFRHLPYFNFYCDPKRPAVSCPQPNGHHRFEFMLMPGQTKEYMESPETVREFLSHYVDIDKVEVLRSLVYTFNALVAERWREGRVLLAGDAAHMTPQFMGQGMSSGVRDAYNLAWKLDAVIAARAGDQLIDSYERERKPHAKEMIDVSVRMKDFVSMANPAKAMLRDAIVKGMLVTPGLREYIREMRFKPPPTYPQGAYLGLPRKRRNGAEGRPIPQPVVRTFDGKRGLLDEFLGEEYALLGYAIDPREALDAKALARLAALGARYITVFPFGNRPQGESVSRNVPPGLVELDDLDGGLIGWLRGCGARPGWVALIRPDKFVYALTPAQKALDAVAHLARTLQTEERLALQGGCELRRQARASDLEDMDPLRSGPPGSEKLGLPTIRNESVNSQSEINL